MLHKFSLIAIAIAAIIGLSSLFGIAKNVSAGMPIGQHIQSEKPDGQEIATFAGGCFWCIESEFRALDGVLYTRSGYTGGELVNPTYRDITTGKTGHAEAVEVTYDSSIITYRQLAEFFLMKAHDPTQLNRQGVDVGPQYRSAFFYHDEAQKKIAEDTIDHVTMNKLYKDKIVTELNPAVTFYEAEEYHQQYYEKYEEKNGVPHLRVMLKKAKK